MRIIGGTLGGRRFYPPAKGWPTRPTTDIAKEALYNILQGRIDFDGVRFLDLFGGTGSHCFEVVSRGSTDATYVESYKPCCAFVRKTATELQIEKYIRIIPSDAFRFCKRSSETWDYIFADPPFGLSTLHTLPDLVFSHGMLAPGGILVLEHSKTNDFALQPYFTEVRVYGDTHFSFFRNSVV